jgi:hypothetical protein
MAKWFSFHVMASLIMLFFVIEPFSDHSVDEFWGLLLYPM